MDAVHAVLAYERSVAAGIDTISIQAPHHFDRSMQTPMLQAPPSPASDVAGAESHREFGVGTRTEVKGERVGIPDSPTSMLAVLGAGPGAGCADGGARGSATATAAGGHVTPTSRGGQGSRSDLRTPDMDATRPVMFSATRMRTRMGGAGRGMGMDGDDGEPTVATRGGGGGGEGGGGRGSVGMFSPPKPTVLFGELAADGGSTTFGKRCALGLEGDPRGPVNDNAINGEVVAHADVLVDGEAAGNDAYCHGGSKVGLGKTVRAMTTTTTTSTTTTTKKHSKSEEAGSGEENTMAALLSLLRLETSKREEVQARAAELEGAIAIVAQEASAAVARAESLASPRQGGETETAAPSPDGGSNVCPCVHLDGNGAAGSDGGGRAGGARQQGGLRGVASHPENLSPDPHAATYVRLDQDRQVAKILGLVREARTKLKGAAGAGCGVGIIGSGGEGREETRRKAARAGRGGSFPVDETET